MTSVRGGRLKAAHEREWRQFTLLSRDSVRRLLNSALLSRDVDPMQFAIWGIALAMTPPALAAVNKVIKYPFMVRLDPDVVERIALADRLYFVIYGMLATALLAALTWEALFPDREDQEIVGVLPVRPRTLAAARFTGAAAAGAMFALAISLPSAIVFSLATSVLPQLGSLPRVLLGHLAATVLGCATVFLALIALRGIVAIVAGERLASRLALLLQVVTIVMLVEVFLFLPGVLPPVARSLQEGNGAYWWFPPVWFAGLYSAIAEGRGVAAHHGVTAIAALLTALLGAALVSLLPAAWMGRRALETRGSERAGGLAGIARAIALVCVRTAEVRAIFLFAVASLARSRRHMVVLASYLGLAIAASLIGLVSAGYRGTVVFHGPESYLMTVPLAFLFCAVIGLRAALSIPTDIEANWPFRMCRPSVSASLRATRLLIVSLAVVPISMMWLLVTVTLWPLATALTVAGFDLAAGLALTEIVLARWTKVPFATPHEPAPETVKSRWPLGIAALYLFAFRMADVQSAALDSDRGTLVYLGVCAAIIGVIRLHRATQLRLQTPTLDVAPDNATQTLNLSEALN